MDWDLAIKRNSKALKGIIEVLFALLGLDGTDAASRIPRSLHSAVLGVLRPAESAVRRLIVVAARNVVVKLAPSRPMPEGRKIVKGWRKSGLPSFQLFDPPKRPKPIRVMKFTRLEPRIHFFDIRSKGCGPVSSASACGRTPATARWPGQCNTPPPQAPGPQARPRGPAPPGQTSRPLAGEAEGLAMAEVHDAAAARPSAGLPEETHSRSR